MPALGAAAALYSAWVWADRMVVQAQVGSNWRFALAVNIVLLGFTALVTLDPHNRVYFGKEAHERPSED
jgi:hypothetical protein